MPCTTPFGNGTHLRKLANGRPVTESEEAVANSSRTPAVRKAVRYHSEQIVRHHAFLAKHQVERQIEPIHRAVKPTRNPALEYPQNAPDQR